MATENIPNQNAVRQNDGVQNKKRKPPYKRHNFTNKNTKENQNTNQINKKNPNDPGKNQPQNTASENNANRANNSKNKPQNQSSNSQNNQAKKKYNQRKRPQIHYDHDNIKMLPNNYVSPVDDDGSPNNSGYAHGESIGFADGYDSSVETSGVVAGRNAVRELLKSNRSVDKLLVRRGDREGSIIVIVAEAVNRHIPVIEVDSSKLDALSGGAVHQGVIAMAAEKEYTDIDSMLKIAEMRGEVPLIVIADEISDPYNLGALIRCAECAGAHGLVIPKRRAAGLTPVVTKASAGAIEHLAIAKVVNIGNTIEQLKKKGLWIYAAEAGGTPYYDTDFTSPAAIVFGSEGNGIGKLIMSKCDFVVSIPMYGHVNSLNVSTAASVILSHAARMHRQK